MTLEVVTRIMVVALYLAAAGMGVAALTVARQWARRVSASVIIGVSLAWSVFYLYLLVTGFHATSESIALMSRMLHYVTSLGLFYMAWAIWDSELLHRKTLKAFERIPTHG